MREGLGEGETEMTSRLSRHARELRKNQTEAERILWNRLRSRQMEGAKFRRQQPIESYIVDFACFEKRLIIELDGGQHVEDRKRDDVRDGVEKDKMKKDKKQKKVKSDGSTASYYELPADAKEVQDLISYKNMNAQIGEIFRACYLP